MRLPCVVMLAALLACGGGGGGDGYTAPPTGPGPGGGNSNPPPPSGSASVQMNSSDDGYGTASHSFSPTQVTITEGGRVTWNNETGFLHTVTFTGTGAPSHIAGFSSGSQSRTFENTGTFNYSCSNHPEMTGRVVVQ